MNTEEHSSSSAKKANVIQVNLDEFNISEDSFRPMTKGLGFHQDQKRASFKPSPKDVKSFGAATKANSKVSSVLSPLSGQAGTVAQAHAPTGLEAFYGAKGNTGAQTNMLDLNIEDSAARPDVKLNTKAASSFSQLVAWLIDVIMVAGFVAITGGLLIFASGIQFETLVKIVSLQDLSAFTAAIFSIYYLLYFTILDLTASPGKTIMGIRLLRADNSNVSVKNTFVRALVSLLSSVALFLPMLLDFQGRLSDTKLVN